MLCCGGDATKEAKTANNGDKVNKLMAAAPPPNMGYAPRPAPPPKTSGISEEVFRQIETVQNRYDSSTAAAFRSVQKSGEMVVRTLDPRQFIRLASETAPKINIDTNDPDQITSFVEIVKRPGQTLGLYMREGNGHDRLDGVFISRIAVESAIYGSGCLQIGDEILAVNLVDVTHMSLDDVVIIMSIPRRLVLTTRRPLGQHNRGNLSNNYYDNNQQMSTLSRNNEYGLPAYRDSRTLTWDRNPKPDRSDPKYFPVSSLPRNNENNLRLMGASENNSSFDEPHSMPMPPPMQDLAARDYNKVGTDKFADKFASFDEYASDSSAGLSRGQRLLHRMAADRRPVNGYGRRSNTLQYRHNNGYANRMNRYEHMSDTEPQMQNLSPATENMSWSAFARSNSLPRNFQREALLRHPELSMEMDRLIEAAGPDDAVEDVIDAGIDAAIDNGIDAALDNGIDAGIGNGIGNGIATADANSAFALPSDLGGLGEEVGMSNPLSLRTNSLYGYGESLRRTPSTSAIYETLRKSKELRESLSRPSSRLSTDSFNEHRRTHDAVQHSYFSDSEPPVLESLSSRRLHSRRARHRTLSTSATAEISSAVATRLMRPASALAKASVPKSELNPGDFVRYKSLVNEDEDADNESAVRLSGLLNLHLLSGRGLRTNDNNNSKRVRDLYCVVEVDHIHKARTVVKTGGTTFDWDEKFDVDLANNLELEFLIYSWDPQLRHRLCYRATLRLGLLFGKGQNFQQVAIQLHPLGTLYLSLGYKTLQETFLRRAKSNGVFGVPLESLVEAENANVPMVVQKCVNEVERRGLDIIGIYRLCGSNSKKSALRSSFERDAYSVELDAKHVPDINVVTGLLREFLRELPQPVVTSSLYEMLVDAMAVFLPDDPDGNAKLIFSILDCLPKANRNCLVLLMDHLCRVARQAEKNKMNAQNLAICFAPVLMLDFGSNAKMDENKARPSASSISEAIRILKYLIEIWPQNQT